MVLGAEGAAARDADELAAAGAERIGVAATAVAPPPSSLSSSPAGCSTGAGGTGAALGAGAGVAQGPSQLASTQPWRLTWPKAKP